MKKLLLGLLVLGGLATMTSASEAPAHSTPANTGGDAEAGKSLTAVCAGCHSADGNSAVSSFPKLAGQGEVYLTKQLKDIKSGKRVIVEMTGLLNGLDDHQLADIAAYYASQTITVGEAKADLVDLGEALYKAGNSATGVPPCAGCHSPNGQGNSVGGFPALGGQHADYTASQLVKFQKGYRTEENSANVRINDGDAKIMRTIAFKLKDFEIEALASYIQGLH